MLSLRLHVAVSMALQDISNISANYSLQVKLDLKYALVIKRGVLLERQSNRSSFPVRKAVGENHIDLWVNGTLYPVDPLTNSPPCFTTMKYLEFLCHGKEGMLGYTKCLNVGGGESNGSNVAKPPQYSKQMVMELQSKVSSYG